jgi:hypothetical protein
MALPKKERFKGKTVIAGTKEPYLYYGIKKAFLCPHCYKDFFINPLWEGVRCPWCKQNSLTKS